MLSMRKNIISEIMFRRYIGWYANIKSENTVHRYNIEREKKELHMFSSIKSQFREDLTLYKDCIASR